MEETDGWVSVYMKSITICSAIGGLLCTYNLSVLSGTLLFIKDEYHLSTVWHELIVSTLIATAAVSSFAAGILNDRFGKKPVLVLASSLFIVGAAVLAGAFRKEIIVAGEIITGSAVGLMYATAPRYIADFAPPHMRGRLVGVYCCFAAFGNMASGLSAGVFSYYPWRWRGMFAVSSIPAFCQCVWFCCLPESPRWLTSQGRQQEARDVLQLVHGEYWAYKIIRHEEIAEEEKGVTTLYRVFTTQSVRRALFVGCGLQFIQQFAGVNAVQYYNSSIVEMAGIKSPVAIMWLTTAINSCSTIGHLISFSLVDKTVSLTGISVSLLLIAMSFRLPSVPSSSVHTATSGNCAMYSSCISCIEDTACGYCYINDGGNTSSCLPVSTMDRQYAMDGLLCSRQNMSHGIAKRRIILEVNVCPSRYTLLTLVGMMGYLLSFGLGMGPVTWLINTEIYPPWASSFCNGCATATSFTSNLIVVMTFLTLTEVISTYGTFLVYFAISIIGIISMYFVLPETKEISLDEVNDLFNEPCCQCQGGSQRKTDYSYREIRPTDTKNGD